MLTARQSSSLENRFTEARQITDVAPQQAKRDEVKLVDFYLEFKKLNEKLLQRQKTLWKSHFMLALRSALYYAGHQVLVPKDGGFGYTIRHLRGDNAVFSMNRLRPFSDDVTAQLAAMGVEIDFAVLTEDERVQERALDCVESLSDYFQYKHFTEMFIRQCGKHGQIAGNFHAEISFDPDGGGQEYRENYKQNQVKGENWYQCLNPQCQSSGVQPNEGMGGCPDCQSPYFDTIPMQGVEFDALESEGWEKSGEVIVKFRPNWSQRYSLTTGADTSPWRYDEEDTVKELLEAEYGKLDGTADEEKWSDDELMHCERIMRRANKSRLGNGQGSEEYGDSEEDDCVLKQRFWHMPEMLLFMASDKTITLPNGEEVPKGERLSDVFPDGMMITTAPGLPRFLDVGHDNHQKRYVNGLFSFNPGQESHGEGTVDALEFQRQTNLLWSGEYLHTQRTLQPSMIVNGKVIRDASRMFNRPNGSPIVADNFPADGDVRKVFTVVEPPQLSPRIPLLREELGAMMQATTKSFNSEGDFAGVKSGTATASRIAQQRGSINQSLSFGHFAGFCKEVKLRSLELAQQHYGELRLIHATDPTTNKRKSKVIRGIDLRCDVMAWVKPGSATPDIEIERRLATAEAWGLRIQIASAGLWTPQVARQFDKLYHTDFSGEHGRERVESCEEALETMIAAMPQAMQMGQASVSSTTLIGGQMMGGPDPVAMYLYSLVPVDAYETGHEMKIAWWRDVLSSSSGKKMPEPLRAAIKLQIDAERAALMAERGAIAEAASVGQGMVAPPVATGMQETQGEGLGVGGQGLEVSAPAGAGEPGTPGGAALPPIPSGGGGGQQINS